MEERRDFYVYVYFRPNGHPCYVGKGKGRRLNIHRKSSCNVHLARLMKLEGCSLPVVILRSGMTEAQAFAMDRALISAIGREVNGGPLFNLTDGGDGCSGLRHSDESRALMSKKRKGKPLGPFTHEHIENLRAARAAKPGMSGKRHSEETKAKMREAQKRRAPISDETRAKMRASLDRRTDIHRNSVGQYAVIEIAAKFGPLWDIT